MPRRLPRARPHLLLAAPILAAALALAGCDRGDAASIASIKTQLDKDDKAAEVSLKSFLAKNPESGEARYLLGSLLLRRGDAAAARIELQRARDKKYDEALVTPALAQSMIESGDAARVIEQFEKTRLTDARASARLDALLARAYLQRNSRTLAAEVLERALTAVPDSPEALAEKVRLELAGNDLAKSQAAMEDALKRAPGSAELWSLSGEIALVTGKTAEAETALRKAVSLDGHHVPARRNLVRLLLGEGRLEDAEKELPELRRLAPNAFATAHLDGTYFLAKGELDKARTAFQAMLRAAPESVVALIGGGEVEYRMHAYAQAAAMAGKAATLAPDNAPARLLLAQVQIAQGQGEKALKTVLPFVEGRGGMVYPQMLAIAAEAMMSTGDLAGADRLYARLRDMQPKDKVLRIAVARARLGNPTDFDAALAELQTLAREENSSAADLAIISACMRAKKWPQALAALDALQTKRPKDALPLQLRAAVQRENKDLAGARASLEAALQKDPRFMPALLALADLDTESGALPAARQRLEAVLKDEPKNATVLLALSRLSLLENKPLADTIALLERTVAADPNAVPAHLMLVDAQLRKGDARAAASAVQTALSANPEDLRLLERQGRLQLQSGAVDQALATAAKELSLSPSATGAHLIRAEALLVGKNLVEAERSATYVLGREPKNLDAQAVLIRIRMAQGRAAEALKVAQDAIAQRPDQPVGHALAGEILASQGQWAQAAKAFQAAVERGAPTASAMKLHNALMHEGRADAAAEAAERWTKQHPEDADYLFYVGDAEQRANKLPSAESWYRRAIAARADHPLALNNLAMVLVAQNKPGALELIDKALARAPNEAAFIDTKSQVLEAEGKTDLAIDLQRQAVLAAPRNDELKLRLARLMIKAGQRTEARAELRRLAGPGSTLNAQQRQEASELLRQLAS